MITGSWMVGMLRSLTSDYNSYTTEAGSCPVGHCKVLRFPCTSTPPNESGSQDINDKLVKLMISSNNFNPNNDKAA